MKGFVPNLRRGVAWSFAAQVGKGLSTVLGGMVLARLLTLEQLGLYFLFVQVVNALSIVNSFGMPSGLMKLGSIAASQEHWSIVRRLVGYTGLLFALSSVALGIAWLTVWPVLAERLFKNGLPLAIGALIFAVIMLRTAGDIGSAFFRAVGRIELGVMMLDFPREFALLASFAVSWVAFGQSDIVTVQMIYFGVVLAIATATVALVARFYASHSGSATQTDEVTFSAFSGLCFPMVMQGMSSVLLTASGIWVLGFSRPASEVGVYGAVARLTILVAFFLNVVNNVLPPLVAAAYKEGRKKDVEEMMRTAAGWCVLSALPIVFICLFFGKPVLRLTFGPAFEGGVLMLSILIIGQAVNAGVGSPGVLLKMTGFHTLLTNITMAIAVVNLLGNLMVVGRFGAEGIALVTALSVIGQNLTMLYFARRKVGIWTIPTLQVVRLRRMRRIGNP